MAFVTHEAESKIPVWQSALAGGGAGSFTRAIAQPLDVLKIRFQLQTEPIKAGKGSKYSSLPQAVASIVKEEGISTLWSGHVPAQLLSITFGILQFSTFEKLTQLCELSNPQFYDIHKHWINFSNGAVAASIATVVSFPLDTVRTRLIAEEKTKKAYKGLVHAVFTMTKSEGVSALFKGLIPTLGQIAPHAGLQFVVYKLFADSIFPQFQYLKKKHSWQNESTMSAKLIAGSIAGFVAKTAIYPFDLVKKRLQIQGFQKHRTSFGRQMYCNGLFDCVRLIVTEEGFSALYKGYWPSLLKAVLVTALHFTVYDEIKSIFLKMHS